MADKIQYIQIPEAPQQKVNEVGYLPPTAANANPAISLKEYFDSQILEKEKRYEQRFAAQQEAVIKSEVAMEKRFQSVNEFRDTLKDQHLTFVTKAEIAAKFELLGKIMDKNQEDINAIRLTLANFLTLSEYGLRHSELQAQVTILRDAMNTDKGKTTIADPATSKAIQDLQLQVTSLSQTRSLTEGGNSGRASTWSFVIAGAGVVIAIIGLASRFL